MTDIANYLTNDVYRREALGHQVSVNNRNHIKINDLSKYDKNFSQILGKEKAKISSGLVEQKINIKGNNSESKTPNPGGQNGTDLAAMERTAKELADQLYGFLWSSIAEGVTKNPQGGFGEEMFQKSLWPEMVKMSRGEQQDKLQEAIVRDLIKAEARVHRDK